MALVPLYYLIQLVSLRDKVILSNHGSLDVQGTLPKAVDTHLAIEYLRVLCLLSCFTIAGYSDYSRLIVRDKIWILWSLPAIFLLILDFLIIQLSIWNILMVFSLISLALPTVFQTPTFDKSNLINFQNLPFLFIYILGTLGFIGGLFNYVGVDYYSLVSGDENLNATIWWTLLFASLSIIIFIYAYKIGLIQGGADIKALIWVTILTPSWYFVPKPYIYYNSSIIDYEDIIFQLPPSFVLFLWAGGIFIFTPPIFLTKNIIKGNIKKISDLKIAWHAIKIPLSEIEGNKLWILSDVIIDKSGDVLHTTNLFASQKITHNDDISKQIEYLQEKGLKSAWVTRKHPFVTYLFIAIIPMFIFGDPVVIMINLL